MWARLGAVALGLEPPPLAAILEEVRRLLGSAAIARADSSVIAAAEHLGASRPVVRRALGYAFDSGPVRARMDAVALAQWHTAAVGHCDALVLPVSDAARAVAASGALRVTVQADDV
jgi:hypothetical protein